MVGGLESGSSVLEYHKATLVLEYRRAVLRLDLKLAVLRLDSYWPWAVLIPSLGGCAIP